MISVKRKLGGVHLILRDGQVIGETWKCRKSSGFAVNVKGVYWRAKALEPNICGGAPVRIVPRLKNVPEFVAEALQYLKK